MSTQAQQDIGLEAEDKLYLCVSPKYFAFLFYFSVSYSLNDLSFSMQILENM
jgi:hypothetical protein